MSHQAGDTEKSNAPTLSSDAIHDDLRPVRVTGRALRRSLYYTTMGWIFGAFWMAASTGGTVTELAKYLGANDRVFGLLAAVPFVAVLMQLPGSLAVEYVGRRKGIFLWWGTIHRSIYFVVAALPWLLPPHTLGSAYVLVCTLLISSGCGNFSGQAWVNWMADLVPPRVRGRYFARRSRYGIAVVICTSLLMAWLLDTSRSEIFHQIMAPVERLTGLPPLVALISIIMFIAAIAGMADIQTFRKVEEPPLKKRPKETIYLKLSRPLKDFEFRRYLAYAAVWSFANFFCGTFWWVYLLDFLDRMERTGVHAWWVEHKYIMAYLPLACAYPVGQLLTLPLWGRLIDKFGRRPALFVSSTLHTISWAPWLFISPATVQWLIATQMIGGMFGAGQDVCNFNMVLTFNRKGGPAYQALTQIGVSAAAVAATITAGNLAQNLHGVQWHVFTGTNWEIEINRYSIIIAISILLKYAGDLVLLAYVHEPEAKSRMHAVRFLFGNMYGNLNTLIFTPLQKMNPVNAENIGKWFK